MSKTNHASRVWTAAMMAVVALYVGFMAVVGRFPSVDEVFFKAAGREWAMTGRFAAPELRGLPFLSDESPGIDAVWFVHPPGYPFLFGVFVKLFGFGPDQCIVFDAFIHAVLAFLTYLLARRIGENAPPSICFAIAVAVLPLATFGRPDELAMCFGMASVLMLLGMSLRYRSILLSGLFLGLSAATFVGPAIMLGIVGVTLLLSQRQTVATIFARLAVFGATASFVLLIAVAPILVQHPRAPLQYLDHLRAHVGDGDFLIRFFTGWEYEEFHRSIALACVSVAVLGLISSWRFVFASLRLCARSGPERHAKAQRREEKRKVHSGFSLSITRWARLWVGPMLAIIFVATFVPNKMYYLWFVGPWMMVAAAMTWRAVAAHSHPLLLRVGIVWVAALYAVAVSSFVKNTAIMLTLPESQTLRASAREIRRLIPPGSRVVSDHVWWALAGDRHVFDRYFSRVDPMQVEYVVLAGDGSGNPNHLSDVPALAHSSGFAQFEMFHNNVNTQRLAVMGRSLPGTAHGFGVAVLRRRTPPHDMMTVQDR